MSASDHTATPASSTPPPIRDAATLILLREGASGAAFEVLMVRRQRGAVFMADAYVFPGGRTEPEDGGDFLVSAAREAFEEAGVLLARDASGAPLDSRTAPWLAEEHARVNAGEISFRDLLSRRGLVLDAAACVHCARWITPPTEPRRFDARFFLARMPPGQDARPDASGEVVEFRWDTPERLLAAQERGELKLPPPTIWHLTELSRCGSIDGALGWARSVTIVPVRPKLYGWPDGTVAIVLPWDPEYDVIPVEEGEALPLTAAGPLGASITRFVLEDGRWIGRTP